RASVCGSESRGFESHHLPKSDLTYFKSITYNRQFFSHFLGKLSIVGLKPTYLHILRVGEHYKMKSYEKKISNNTSSKGM
ncbi:MAG: hypothetical protein WCO13_14540, partial [Bacteroidota bacterium]